MGIDRSNLTDRTCLTNFTKFWSGKKEQSTRSNNSTTRPSLLCQNINRLDRKTWPDQTWLVSNEQLADRFRQKDLVNRGTRSLPPFHQTRSSQQFHQSTDSTTPTTNLINSIGQGTTSFGRLHHSSSQPTPPLPPFHQLDQLSRAQPALVVSTIPTASRLDHSHHSTNLINSIGHNHVVCQINVSFLKSVTGSPNINNARSCFVYGLQHRHRSARNESGLQLRQI
jgi:hypothetical protein